MKNNMAKTLTAFVAVLGVLSELSSAFQTRFEGMEDGVNHIGDSQKVKIAPLFPLRHKVYRVTPRTKRHVKILANLGELEGKIDKWQDVTGVDQPVDLQVSPEVEGELRELFSRHGLPHKIIIKDVQKLLEWHKREHVDKRAMTEHMFNRYHDLTEIMTFLDNKATRCGTNCSIFTTGTSFEGHLLRGIKITDGSGRTDKRAVWIDAGIHAREWISHTTAMYFIDRLIEDHQTDDSIQELLRTYDWYIYPVVNPDGYLYSWSYNRFWRKSRSINESTSCVGADINRNFDFYWMETGASSDPCSNTFAGYYPFSEPESRAQAHYMLVTNPANWYLFISLHSYSQLIMAPWGYSRTPPPDIQQLLEAGEVGRVALESVHGTPYLVGSASSILYLSSGTSRDWAKGVPKIKYVYTIELRPNRSLYGGFIIEPEEILPTGQETWAGVKAIADFISTKTE